MATSKSDMKTKIAELRHEILSYKPGKAVPCDDELVVFPDRLIISVMAFHVSPSQNDDIVDVSVLRRAIHGDVEAIKYAGSGRRETSTEGPEKYLTDSILVMEKIHFLFREVKKDVVKDLAAKVGCFVVLMGTVRCGKSREVISTIKEITGRYPIVGLRYTREEQVDVELERKRMREEGIAESMVYGIPTTERDQRLSDTEQLHLLNLMQGCLREGDTILANAHSNELLRDQRYGLLYNRAKKKITEARQRGAKLEEELKVKEEAARSEVKRIKKEKEEERARLENKLKSEKERVVQLQHETWKLRTKIQLESEIRSAEQKKKAETSQWGFIPSMSSGTGTSLSEDPFNRGSRGSDGMQAGKELPEDEFAGILKRIADNLYDEAKIDSLGSELGILQGDIQRALMTNVRFNRVTSEGTRHMLKQWRRSVPREDEQIELRRALEAAKLFELADLYLPEKDAAKVTGSDELQKLQDSHGQSGKDSTPLTQGSPRGRTEVEETAATIDHSSPDDTSYLHEEENEGISRQSAESSNHSKADVQDVQAVSGPHSCGRSYCGESHHKQQKCRYDEKPRSCFCYETVHQRKSRKNTNIY